MPAPANPPESQASFGQRFNTKFWRPFCDFWIEAGIKTYLLAARGALLVSKGGAYGSVFYVALSALLMGLGVLAVPVIVLASKPLAGVAAIAFLCGMVLLAGFACMAAAAWLNRNIHRALVIPHRRRANTAFEQLMLQVKLNDEEAERYSPHSSYNELKEALARFIKRKSQAKEFKSIDKLDEQFKAFKAILDFDDNADIPLFLLQPQHEPRRQLWAILLVGSAIEIDPDTLAPQIYDAIRDALKSINKLLSDEEDLDIDAYVGFMQSCIEHSKESGSVDILAAMRHKMQRVWELVDAFKAERRNNTAATAEVFRRTLDTLLERQVSFDARPALRMGAAGGGSANDVSIDVDAMLQAGIDASKKPKKKFFGLKKKK